MPKQVPKRLGKEPLIESLWEIRFSSETNPVADLLPGLVFAAFPGEFPKIEPLPAANIPLQIRQLDANFRHTPTVRLRNDHYVIQIGEHVVSLSCLRPYKGWEEFGEKIRKLAGVLKETNLINNPERFSMKYTDILPAGNGLSIAPLDIVISLGGGNQNMLSLQLRTEVIEEGFVNIIQIISPADVQLLGGEKISGTLVDNDTIYDHKKGDFWQNFHEQLDQMHAVNKRMFFNLLKEETITNLEPEY